MTVETSPALSQLPLSLSLPWVERRQEGRLIAWGRTRHLSQLPLYMSLPWVERRQERRLLHGEEPGTFPKFLYL
jgi:hypothetical protein